MKKVYESPEFLALAFEAEENMAAVALSSFGDSSEVTPDDLPMGPKLAD